MSMLLSCCSAHLCFQISQHCVHYRWQACSNRLLCKAAILTANQRLHWRESQPQQLLHMSCRGQVSKGCRSICCCRCCLVLHRGAPAAADAAAVGACWCCCVAAAAKPPAESSTEESQLHVEVVAYATHVVWGAANLGQHRPESAPGTAADGCCYSPNRRALCKGKR